MSDNKSILIKFLKVMAAYFGLYVVHYIIVPNSYILPGSIKIYIFISLLLFPVIDIIYLKSNIFFGFLGIVLYSICVYIYDANAVYELGYRGIFEQSYSKEWLAFELIVWIVVYVIIYIITFIIISIIRAIKKHIKNKKDREGKI